MNKQLVIAALGAGLTFASLGVSRAASVTFAQVNQGSATLTNTFVGGNFVGSNYFSTTTPELVTFFFQDPGTGPIRVQPGKTVPFNVAQGIIADLTFSTATDQAAFPSGGGATQDFGDVLITIKVRGNQTVGGVNFTNGENLLTVRSGPSNPGSAINATGGELSTTNINGGTSGQFSQNDLFNPGDPTVTNEVTFTSDYLNFTGAIEDGYSLALSGVQRTGSFPSNQNGFRLGGSLGSNYFQPFRSQFTGTFSSAFDVPEPGSVALMAGMGISGSAFFLRRRRRSK